MTECVACIVGGLFALAVVYGLLHYLRRLVAIVDSGRPKRG